MQALMRNSKPNLPGLEVCLVRVKLPFVHTHYIVCVELISHMQTHVHMLTLHTSPLAHNSLTHHTHRNALMYARREDSSAATRYQRAQRGDEIDARFGFERYHSSAERMGWLINIHPVSSYFNHFVQGIHRLAFLPRLPILQFRSLTVCMIETLQNFSLH